VSINSPVSARLRGALAALATLLMVGLVQPPATARALIAPPQDLAATTVPVLSWSTVPGAVRYEVQVDNNDTFGSPEFTAKTTNTRVVPTSALSGVVYWRVRAFDSAGVDSDWNQSDVDLGVIGAPDQLSPDGDTLAQPDQPPLLAWHGVAGATGYTVELDTDPDFVAATAYTTATTSLVIPTALEARTYYWRVTAKLGTTAVSIPSETASFDVLALDAPVQTSPADSPDTQVEDVVLDWDPVPGAASYDLRVARDADFNTIIDTVTGIKGTSYSPVETYNNAQYYWQVRAVDLGSKPTAWRSVQNSFERYWPDQPTPLHPTGAVGSPPHFEGVPYFQWTPVDHASHYQLDVGTDPNFSPTTFVSCRVAGTTYTAGNVTVSGGVGGDDKCRMQDGAVFYWRVRAMDAPTGVQGIYSPIQAAIWDGHYLSGFSPTGGAIVEVPTFSWAPVSGVETYQVSIIDTDTEDEVFTAETHATSYSPTKVDADVLAPGKVYAWSLMAVAADKSKSLIYSNTFQVSGNLPTTSAPALTPLTGTAADAPTLKPPSLTWEPYPGAAYYKISIGNSGTGAFWTDGSSSTDVVGDHIAYPAVTETSTRTLLPGGYDWQVRAYNLSGGVVATGPVATFTIKDFAAMTGQSLALDGATLDADGGCTAHLDGNGTSGPICDNVPATPVLSWQPKAGASFYLVYISSDSSFTNLLEKSIKGTTTTYYAPTFSNAEATYADSQAGKSYYWMIRPCKAINICAPDPVSTTGKATNAFRKASPPVTLLSPANDTSPAAPNLGTGEITFTWRDYLATNQDTTWAATGEASPQAAHTYTIQISTSATFSKVLETATVDQTTFTSPSKLYPDGQLFWRVQAVDGDAKNLSWSETRSFMKYTDAPTPTFPVADTAVSGTAAFQWSAQPFAGSYTLEVYKDNDTTFSSANRVVSKSSIKTTAYSPDKPLPPSNKPYLWRVRITDPSNNVGQWSVAGRFYSTGDAPALLEPAASTQQPDNGPLFSWTAVPGAARYKIVIATSTRTVTTVTTSALAYATTTPLPDGKLTWQVTALDSAGQNIGTSETRAFTVDAKAPTVVTVAPASQIKTKGKVTVTFSEQVKNVTTKTFRIYVYGKSKPLKAKVTLDATKTKATLKPAKALKIGTRYSVKLSPSITDLAGHPLTGKSWNLMGIK